MPLVIACPGCSKQFRIADEHAGKQVKCPACQTVFQVPANPPAGPGFAPEQAAVPKRPMPRDSSAAPVMPQIPVMPQVPVSPQPAMATPSGATSFSSAPGVPLGAPKPSDPARSMGVASLVLGILSAIGEFISVMSVFFGSFCCLCLPFGLVGVVMVPTLMIPAGIGLALGLKAEGGMKIAGLALNAIALALGALAILGMVLLFVFNGTVVITRPLPGRPFPPPYSP